MSDESYDPTPPSRLLPWTGPEGKPCYLVGDGVGHVSRLADQIESVQLGMAGGLLDHAADLLTEHRLTGEELHYLARRLSESLRDVKRVAESRGARLVRRE
ncbi:hypothetical protein [Streptomyces sp. NPDC093060]|uniref:hypothetical protein n=1 Tax=Streptomyces sp. NPDC093060 TaxID=3366019 RepID=UPI0037F20C90